LPPPVQAVATATAPEPLRARVMAVFGKGEAIDSHGERGQNGAGAPPPAGWELETAPRTEVDLPPAGTAGADLRRGARAPGCARCMRTRSSSSCSRGAS